MIEMPLELKSETADAFRNRLCRWYHKNRRSLPWRRDPTPYRVWISEIMLQQTQVKTVISYYKRFLNRFPDIASLAFASEEEVLSFWAGLGYYSRARNLLKAARHIVEFHNGIFPTDYKTVLSLPGIGRYTAGAICSIALNQPYPIVEGNIRRVIARLSGIRKNLPEKYFWDQMTSWVPEKNASDFNQAMMELGATICLPAQPLCSRCPVRTFCRAKALNLQDSIPLPKPRRAVKNIELVILIFKRNGKVLLTKRKDSFIPGTWGLPCLTVTAKHSPLEAAGSLNQKFSNGRILIDYVAGIRHSITHNRITAHIFTGEPAGTILQLSTGKSGAYWATEAQSVRLLTSSLFRKALERCREQE